MAVAGMAETARTRREEKVPDIERISGTFLSGAKDPRFSGNLSFVQIERRGDIR
jgi:hypothetical protein